MATAQKSSKITAAMAKPENEVPVQNVKIQRSTTSFTAQIADLEVGECVSRIGQLRTDMTMGEFAEQSATLKANFRNNIAPSVRGAKSYTNGEYTIEIATVTTTPGMVYLIAIVTRTL